MNVGDLLGVVAPEHVQAGLLFARLPWPVRRLLGRLRLWIGRLRLSREQRAWVRDLEDEDGRR